MPRKSAVPTPVAPEPAFNEPALQKLQDDTATLAHLREQANDNAKALAVQLGYEGSLTVGALEDQVRFYQHRTVEAVMGLGASLLLLKELTPHGEYKARVELLGIEYQTCKKFMAAAAKFSKGSTSTLLKSAGTQSKLLELLVLDDGEIEALESGESARGITLDKIETMGVRELREALRQSKAELDVTVERRTKAERRADELESKQKRLKPPTPDETAIQLRAEIEKHCLEAQALIMGTIRDGLEQLAAHAQETGTPSHEEWMAGQLSQLDRMVREIRGRLGIKAAPDGSDVPAWVADAQGEINGMAGRLS